MSEQAFWEWHRNREDVWHQGQYSDADIALDAWCEGRRFAREEIERLRDALQQAADMTEHEADRTVIYNHCMQAAESGGE